jgi:hypothetical protein
MLVMIAFNENLPAIKPFKDGKTFARDDYIAEMVNSVFLCLLLHSNFSTSVSSISSTESNGRNGEPSGCIKDKLLACPKWVSAVTKALIRELWGRALLGIEPQDSKLCA